MTFENFYTLLRDTLKEEKETIVSETEFKKLDSYDSLSSIAILQMVEEQFDTKLNPRSFRKMNTVQDLIDEIGTVQFD